MKQEQCRTCKYCAWVDKIKDKYTCECFRPNYWGLVDEDNQDCIDYQYCSYETDREEE